MTFALTTQAALATDTLDIGKPVQLRVNRQGELLTAGSAPVGGATSAKQDTLIGHVDGIETLIGSTNTLLAAPTPAGENHIGEVGGKIVRAAASQMTRPADVTAYASGDLVANSTTAGSVTPLSFTVARVAAGSGMIRRLRIKTSSTSITNAQFRLHLYTTSPTVTNGDNGVWLSAGSANYIGSMDVTLDKAFSDGAAGLSAVTEINFALASGQLVYGLLEARAAYTPTSAGTFDVALEVIQN